VGSAAIGRAPQNVGIEQIVSFGGGSRLPHQESQDADDG
jgi:hypothetical protein